MPPLTHSLTRSICGPALLCLVVPVCGKRFGHQVHRELLEIGTIEDDIECVARSLEGINEILTKVGARMFTPDPQKKVGAFARTACFE